nr:hypothetical protein CFP56_52377 [Quercus suber]
MVLEEEEEDEAEEWACFQWTITTAAGEMVFVLCSYTRWRKRSGGVVIASRAASPRILVVFSEVVGGWVIASERVSLAGQVNDRGRHDGGCSDGTGGDEEVVGCSGSRASVWERWQHRRGQRVRSQVEARAGASRFLKQKQKQKQKQEQKQKQSETDGAARWHTRKRRRRSQWTRVHV